MSWTENNILECTDFETGEFDWDRYTYLCELFDQDEDEE